MFFLTACKHTIAYAKALLSTRKGMNNYHLITIHMKYYVISYKGNNGGEGHHMGQYSSVISARAGIVDFLGHNKFSITSVYSE